MNKLEKFNELVESFASLPTIGKKTALRLAYHLCMQNNALGLRLAHNIENALQFTRPCKQCGGLSENELCEICADTQRDFTLICVVQSPKDILIIEDSKSYNGLYFVLENTDEMSVERLEKMAVSVGARELIFALTHGLNTDALIFYIEDKLRHLKLKLSQIAQGIPSGVGLENVDFISLNKAINLRTKIEE